MSGQVFCVLCRLSEETKVTGALSTKDTVTAHQNCLLYSSNIFCRNSPQFDDLFGFTVEDVLDEVKRGSKLICHYCKKKGATVGCEIKRCKKSYHYPCAGKEGAVSVEDNERFGVFCFKHYQKQIGDNAEPENLLNLRTTTDSSKAGPSKAFSSTGGSTGGGPVYSSDSNSSSSAKHCSVKRKSSSCEKQKESPLKRLCKDWKRKIYDDSPDSDKNEPDSELAPIECDIDDSGNSGAEHQFIGTHTPSPTRSPSGNQLEDENKDEIDDDDEADRHSYDESQSLLRPAGVCPDSSPLTNTEHSTQTELFTLPNGKFRILVKAEVETVNREREGSSPEQSAVTSLAPHTGEPSVPQQSSTGPSPPPDQSEPCSAAGSPRGTGSATSPAPPDLFSLSTLSSPCPSPSPLAALPSDPGPNISSTSFWKSCNAAGCTQAIFTDFINGMNDISSRIQSDQASQEDYDLALSVMQASGKLEEFVAKQDEELQSQQRKLQKAAAAMREIVSAVRK